MIFIVVGRKYSEEAISDRWLKESSLGFLVTKLLSKSSKRLE